jgi:molybdopterin-containing oxidoreductase family iron-sulfur binding subunit
MLKKEVIEGEFQTACSNACSGMTFGDINVKESPIAKLVADDRMYHLLST